MRISFPIVLFTLLVLHGVNTERAANAQVPAAPYEIVPLPADDADLRARLDGAADGIWLDGDVLWLARIDPAGASRTIGGIAVPLERVGDSDLCAAGLRWSRWPEAFVRIAFLGTALPAGPIEYCTWRGDHAPEPAPTAEPGRVASFDLPGPVPDSRRTITVVLPPALADANEAGAADDALLPAIVLADGQSAEAWGRVVAALVRRGAMRRVAIIGVHSGRYAGDRAQPYDPQLDIRAREYLEAHDRERFTQHLDWVIDTVLPHVAQHFGVSLKREELAVAGFSNGGAFAATAGVRRRDVFGTVLALSVGVAPDLDPHDAGAPLPRCFLAAGELEPNFLHHTRTTRDTITAAGGTATLTTFVAGHDADMWTRALAHFAPTMFPVREDERDE